MLLRHPLSAGIHIPTLEIDSPPSIDLLKLTLDGGINIFAADAGALAETNTSAMEAALVRCL